MTGLDLSAVERVILAWAIDELEIHRDNGVADDELDPQTLLLIPTEGELVWSGLGALQPLAGFGDDGDPDVVRIIEQTGARYRALLPLRDVTGARVGDVLTVKGLHSPSADPRLQGRAFSIVHLGYPASFAVTSIVYLRPVLDPAAPTTPPDAAPDPDPGP